MFALLECNTHLNASPCETIKKPYVLIAAARCADV